MKLNWGGIQLLKSKSYVCGHCGNSLASEKGWIAAQDIDRGSAHLYICHHCNRPTFFDTSEKQTPGVIFGGDVQDVDNEFVRNLYIEARNCTSKNAFTASVLCCRKLLMHIAVSKGAKEGESFLSYVEYLSNNNFIPPDAKGWVDHIRTKGNEANHEIVIMKKEDAEDLISFIEMILRLVYEFPANIKRKMTPLK